MKSNLSTLARTSKELSNALLRGAVAFPFPGLSKIVEIGKSWPLITSGSGDLTFHLTKNDQSSFVMIFGALSNVAYRVSVVSDPDGEAEQASQEGGKSQHLTKSPVKRQSSACEQSMVGAEGCNPCLVVDLVHPKIWEKMAQLKEGQELGIPADTCRSCVEFRIVGILIIRLIIIMAAALLSSSFFA